MQFTQSESPLCKLSLFAYILVTFRVTYIFPHCVLFEPNKGIRVCEPRKILKYSSEPCPFTNLMLYKGVYCSREPNIDKCQAFTGRIEYEIDIKRNKFLGTVSKRAYSNSYGWHERVPISYRIDGSMRYADESIHWWYERSPLVNRKNHSLLMSTTTQGRPGLNWCLFYDKWPVKSSFLDSTGQYKIYFFSRQSCIMRIANLEPDSLYHYNTRFQHNTTLRIDNDINPTIFPVKAIDINRRTKRQKNDKKEDKSVKPDKKPPTPKNDPPKTGNNTSVKMHLVKHHRQHFDVQDFEIIESPANATRFFIKMYNLPQGENWLEQRGPLISFDGYKGKTKLSCMTDFYSLREDKFNAYMVESFQGVDQPETCEAIKGRYYHVGLHSIPREDKRDTFFGFDTYFDDKDANWKQFAYDGYTVTAFTVYPIDKDKYKVIGLIAEYKKVLGGKTYWETYNENYPKTYFIKYDMRMGSFGNGYTFDPTFFQAISSSSSEKHQVDNLNYIDDIAYLPKCKTIVTVFGPVYNEIPAELFSPEATAPIRSIYELGLYTTIGALFSVGDKLYAHVHNEYVTVVTYTCGNQNGRGYVTGEPAYGGRLKHVFEYFPKGKSSIYKNIPEFMLSRSGLYIENIDEQEMISRLTAPNPLLYPLPALYDIEALNTDYTLLYLFIGLALALVILMGLICLATMRKKHRRWQDVFGSVATLRSALQPSIIGSSPTARSNLSGSRASSQPTVRSTSLKRSSVSRNSSINPRSTVRSSSLSKKPSSHHNSRGSISKLPSRSSSHRINSRSIVKPSSSSTRRK